MALNLEVAHAVLYVTDIDRMIAFYTEVLGFEVTDRGPLKHLGETEIVFFSQTARAHHQLALITGREDDRPSPNLHHVAFRSSGSLDDLKALHTALKEADGVSRIMPLTHGNAWSVYFADPEGNGVEIFIDSPWHVAQPQGLPLDLDREADEIVAWTESEYKDGPEFGPIDDFYASRAEHLGSVPS